MANASEEPAGTKEVALRDAILEIFSETGERYGSPRVHAELRARGIIVAKRNVENTCVAWD